jgi:hypothetical protein
MVTSHKPSAALENRVGARYVVVETEFHRLLPDEIVL